MNDEIPYVVTEGRKMSLAAIALALMNPLQGSDINPENLYNQIKQHEGYRQVVYKDSMGIPTVGIGFNLAEKHNQQFLKTIGVDINEVLRGKPLTEKQVRLLYNFSLKTAYKDVVKLIPDFKKHPKEAKKALIDFSFNLGYNKLSKFKGVLRAFERGDYEKASLEMKYKNGVGGDTTPWYKQTKSRAVNLVRQMSSAAR